MALKKHIQELQKRREEVQMGGGEKAIEKQEAMGKMTARNRIYALLDKNSFQEYDMFVLHEAEILTWLRKYYGDGVVPVPNHL
jgi:acetyl-CoA carboxylase carboxyltransferase component